MIKTIGELKKAVESIDDDFTIDVRIVRELSEEELNNNKYPYPYEYSKANIEIEDIGYSDNDVFINIYEDCVSNDMCEWKLNGVYLISPHPLVSLSCITDYGYRYNYCPVCGKKIKAVE